MHKALTQKTRELTEAKSARDVAVAEVSSMKGKFEDSNHRVVQMEKELNAALEELETNRQYIRQLSQAHFVFVSSKIAIIPLDY